MYCKVTHPIPSYAAAQQQCQQLDQFILNLQTPGSSDPNAPPDPSATSSSASDPSATNTTDPSTPDAQLPGQSQPNQLSQPRQLNQQRSQPAQPAQLIPLATVLDSAQGDAIWFASPRNAQLMRNKPTQLNCELPQRELGLGEAGSPLLYRVTGCNQARRCCCTCTKLCAHRCLHDCFVRLWLWKRELDSLGVATSPAQLSRPAQPAQAAQPGEGTRVGNTRLVSAASPYFATQCAVLNVYTSYKQLSQVIGSTVSARMNTYIREAQARGGTNLNAMDYSMQLKLNAKGKPIADPDTGRLEVLYWPQSGLCPFCLPDRSYQLKKRKKKVGESHK